MTNGDFFVHNGSGSTLVSAWIPLDTTDGMRLIQTAIRDWPAPRTISARAPYGHASSAPPAQADWGDQRARRNCHDRPDTGDMSGIEGFSRYQHMVISPEKSAIVVLFINIFKFVRFYLVLYHADFSGDIMF